MTRVGYATAPRRVRDGKAASAGGLAGRRPRLVRQRDVT
jgi:hypothetical protein